LPKRPKSSSTTPIDGKPDCADHQWARFHGATFTRSWGVTPLVNINGTITVMGGSVMKPEVMELIRQGNQHFVMIDELEIAAGKFIAKICKSPRRLYRPW